MLWKDFFHYICIILWSLLGVIKIQIGSPKKGASHKSKFEMDQHNRETEMAKKRAAEEVEHKEAAKYRKVVADSSVEVIAALKQFAPPPHSENVSVLVEEKKIYNEDSDYAGDWGENVKQ